MLMVGVWANRGWVLGNLINEIHARLRAETRTWWVLSVFAGKRRIEKLVQFPLPKHGSYFFSYFSIFESYMKKNPDRYIGKSIVFYPHREDEIGSLEHQVEILNQCFAVYFMCSLNADELVAHGLDKSKVRLVYFAVDIDCIIVNGITRDMKTIVLASRYGPRKGLALLPDLISEMPDWNFIALGRNWEEFIGLTGLSSLSNFSYTPFNKHTRAEMFSRAGIFLSLSNLEGGPVPLIEAMSLNLVPIATDTGFARDLISDKENGFLLSQSPTVNEVKKAIVNTSSIRQKSSLAVKHLTWDRFSQILMLDHREIVRIHGQVTSNQ